MRRTLIFAIVALSLSAALCAVGAVSVSRAVSAAEALRLQAVKAADAGDLEAAASCLRSLVEDWQRRGRVLELVTAHEALYSVRTAAADAIICLEHRDHAEFDRASAALAAALERMRSDEAVRLMNLF